MVAGKVAVHRRGERDGSVANVVDRAARHEEDCTALVRKS
jgi:hypothetical protein